MICIALAAGYATRLYPLTRNFPKPLLEVGGKTILDWLLDDVDASCGVTRHVVVSNARFADHFRDWAAKKSLRAPIDVVDDGTTDNEHRLGAVADIRLAIESLGLDDDLLIVAGDNVLDFSLGRFAGYFREKRHSCIMRYYEPNEARLKKCGVIELGEGDRIARMEEKPAEPKSHWCAPPFYLYAKRDIHFVADGIAAGCATDAPGSFAAYLAGETPVYAMEMPGKRYDVGSLETYDEVRRTYKGIR